MNIFLAALALAAAQTTPAGTTHQGHPAGHEQEPKPHDCKECCRKMAANNGKMDCMSKDGDKQSGDGKSRDSHAGHPGHGGN